MRGRGGGLGALSWEGGGLGLEGAVGDWRPDLVNKSAENNSFDFICGLQAIDRLRPKGVGEEGVGAKLHRVFSGRFPWQVREWYDPGPSPHPQIANFLHTLHIFQQVFSGLYQKNPRAHKNKIGTPPPPPKPPPKRGILRTWFFLQTERIFSRCP